MTLHVSEYAANFVLFVRCSAVLLKYACVCIRHDELLKGSINTCDNYTMCTYIYRLNDGLLGVCLVATFLYISHDSCICLLPDNETLPVVVDVVDKATGEISFGGGYSTASGVIGEVSLQEKNFLTHFDIPKV